MKKNFVLCLSVLMLVISSCLLIINITINTGVSETKKIDRSPTLYYSDADYVWECTCEVHYKGDSYYHRSSFCDFIIDNNDWLDMSRYEAEERGFRPCPNCWYEEVAIR